MTKGLHAPRLLMRNAVFLVSMLLGVGAATAQPAGWKAYFGNLHSHTAVSDGAERPSTAYEFARTQGKLDFLCLSEHNHLSDQAGLTEAFDSSQKATTKAFVGLMGQEYSTIKGGNHINVYDVSDQVPATLNSNYREFFRSFLPEYVKTHPGRIVLAQFNHPESIDRDYGIVPIHTQQGGVDVTFDNYKGNWEEFRTDADAWVKLIAILSGPADANASKTIPPPKNEHKDVDQSRLRIWQTYLERGFHLSPVADQDNHRKSWGTRTTARTGVWIQGPLTRESLLNALKNRRTFASEDENLSVWFTVNGQPMGSQLADPGNADLTFEVAIHDADEPNSKYLVELFHDTPGDGQLPMVAAKSDVVNNGESWTTIKEHIAGTRELYFIHVTQIGSTSQVDDAWSGPVWIETGSSGAAPGQGGIDDETTATAPTTKFVGSRFSGVYHFPECRIAKEIAARGNLVEYPDRPSGKKQHKNCPQ